ncbi:hypothetical protein [Paracoccus aerodenitrificans]|uniref:hypothetical protein n=1 Tax=Paracoccus aerodenitrificans TaxID=3017781 RepID=UPI0022F0EA2A|nr:hypothetical protein [Paracoccus aerodenitrificans]WBU63090.1 hypothetical protein PAE61_12040 [Paracoccus aerodenitrificans]
MIRAHLATFPPRRKLMRQVVKAILPQVDHLFVVLNEYEDMPGILRTNDKVTAIIPNRDVKDAGKFWFKPDPDDIVFTIDDDIGYPPDYVAQTIAQFETMDTRQNVVGYNAHRIALPIIPDRNPWENFLFHQELSEITPIALIGTGTVCARGSSIPDLKVMEPYVGLADIAYCHWLFKQQILPWALPRKAGWLPRIMHPHLMETSLFYTFARKRDPHMRELLKEFLMEWPHLPKRRPSVTQQS